MHQHSWKMAGGEAGPCAEGKGPPARAGAKLGRTAGFPGRGRGELAAERRGEGKGASPKQVRKHLESRRGQLHAAL